MTRRGFATPGNRVACGGTDLPADATRRSAALAGNGGPATASMKTAQAVMPASGQQPLPDCHPEGCAGLRIIDGNAEAYRIDAMRRAEQGS
ncbi:MAG: hypothetical protein JWP72_372 [Massilia sp.]|nr:hypothetical protein [Massilia sp.]MDB5793331.1 hypothetical protein [Massilia sp.]